MKNLIYIIAAITLLGTACKSNTGKRLQVYGNRQAVTKTVAGQTVTDTLYQTLPEFRFINQYGDSITNKTLDSDIYVADFFFTSCPSICPLLQRNLLKVYDAYKNEPGFKIISHTIDPQHDSVPVLKRYADKLGVTGSTWWFLQGKKDYTYWLAEHGYLTVAKQGDGTPGGILHQGFFILIDKQKRIRGIYNGLKDEDVQRLIADVKILRADPEQHIAE
jgi:protein SCO1/2